MTNKKDTTPRCQVCDVPWAEHDGPIKMCEMIQALRNYIITEREFCETAFSGWIKAASRADGRAATIRRLLAQRQAVIDMCREWTFECDHMEEVLRLLGE